MGLDFGLLGEPGKLQTADYRSAGSHQLENMKVELVTDLNVYEVIHTVTIGKTFYVSMIIISHLSTSINTMTIATGASGSEVDFLKTPVNETTTFILPLPTPLKFSSGTRITVRTDTNNNCWFVLAGWEE